MNRIPKIPSNYLDTVPTSPLKDFQKAIFTYSTQENIYAQQDGDESVDVLAIEELDIDFPVGNLTIICGPVGSGNNYFAELAWRSSVVPRKGVYDL